VLIFFFLEDCFEELLKIGGHSFELPRQFVPLAMTVLGVESADNRNGDAGGSKPAVSGGRCVKALFFTSRMAQTRFTK
jgi:hypothetical protein